MRSILCNVHPATAASDDRPTYEPPPAPVPMARPIFGPEEEAAVLAVLRSGQLAQGEQVKAFEESFAASTGGAFGVATSSGSTALLLALRAHGVSPGDEVITSPLTFIATVNAIVQAGAVPIFADVDDTLCIDPEAVLRLIGPRTRAILPVHIHGNPCDMLRLSQIAVHHGLALIQDACQAVGATADGKPLGAFGTAVYSLYATKNLTTGEGGMITTNDATVSDFCARLRHQAYAGSAYLHDAIAFNFRMTEMQAAIGRVQLNRLAAITARRRRVASWYDEAIPSDLLPRPSTLAGPGHVYHHYTLRVPEGGRARDILRERLANAGITTGVYYPLPIYKQPAYRDLVATACPKAEQACADMISIPVHHALTDAEVDRVGSTVAEMVGVAAGV
jgi:perosamine synthetase